ncbi:MAG: hypothetical protein ACI8W8_004208 [Rhodothermales bacterium]|jgi:hypothetical protein
MTLTRTLLSVCLFGALAASAADDKKKSIGYQDTPIIPGTNWHVHDGLRPQPVVVTPAPGIPPIAAPSDAIIVFDGSSLDNLKNKKWKLENGYMEAVRGGGQQTTVQEFEGDLQIHIEFATPTEVKGNGQGRGNSGVFIMGKYEVQVLDNFENQTYPDGQCAAIYAQTPPMVNACRKPGEWQTYDIVWQAPVFADGKLVKEAYVTVIQNGVVVQAHTKITGAATHKRIAKYSPHASKGPISMQDHGNPVRYRNIWVRELQKAK